MIKNENIKFTENIEKFNLENGLKVIFNQNLSFQTASIGFFLKNGSRDENSKEQGYSHFSEHMVFKGTPQLDKKQIANRFDKMGGYINAYTTHELVVIYNRIPFFYQEENISLMYEMFQNSEFDKKEFDLEKEVIINEIHSDLEDPHEKVHEDFMKNIFPDNPLGLPVIGTESSIEQSTKDYLFRFYNEKFTVDDLSIVIAGNFDKVKILEQLKNLKFRRKTDQKSALLKAEQKTYNSCMTVLPSEQVHLILGTSKFSLTDDFYIKMSLLNLVLGESISSLLFQKIREDLGLCYSIYSFYSRYRLENLFGIYASVMPKNVQKTYTAISNVLKDFKRDGISNTSLEQAKNQKIGEIILNHDLLQKEMQRIAYMDLIFNKIYPLEELVKIIQSTTLDELKSMIDDIFKVENFSTQILYKSDIKQGEWEF
jgi:predicted Zn-dependent peptidase